MNDDRRVACLYLETRSREQRTAYEWARGLGEVDLVPLSAIREGSVSLGAYDVCWWHRQGPLSVTDRVLGCRDAVESYLEDGGGLLLTVHALAAVSAWGIDPVPPDAAGVEELPEPTGYLCKSLYADHPLFDGFDGLRVHTRGPSHGAGFARYERLLPEEANVLGCTLRGEEDVPHEAALCSWSIGDGAAIGAGIALSFSRVEADPDDPRAEAARRLVTNALSFLADASEERPSGCSTADRSRSGTSGKRSSGGAEAGANGRSTTFAGGRSRALAGGRPKDAAGLRAMRAALADDPHRPRYHVTPPANWLNDPNGLIEWNGRYHIFYQYNPGGPYHHAIHWGHAVSDDLVTWRDEPVALTPSPNGPDGDGCWSGCAVDDGGTPTLLYTGGRDRIQLPCLATATDADLRTWRKHDANPIIHEPPGDPAILETEHWAAEFRDHCVWYESPARDDEGNRVGDEVLEGDRGSESDAPSDGGGARDDGRWYHLIGTGIQDVGGAVLLYVGDELSEWEYVGPLYVGDWDGAGEVWECPELLDVGDRSLLHVSNYDDVLYFLGDIDLVDGSFEPAHRGLLDHGDYYAPQSMDLSDGRVLTWGWLPEARDGSAQWDAGWAGALSLPRELSLDEDDRLRQRPASELTALRDRRLADDSIALAADDPVSIADGRSIELGLELDLGGADAIDLGLLETPDGAERTIVRYDGESIAVDRSRASLDPAAAESAQSMPIDEPGPLSLRVFVDGSIVECFANERRCLTSRVYPTREDATAISLSAVGGDANAIVRAWAIGSAWE